MNSDEFIKTEIDLNAGEHTGPVPSHESSVGCDGCGNWVSMCACDTEFWVCPVCHHLMSEEQSKSYNGCPTGFHVAQHVHAPLGRVIKFSCGCRVDGWSVELKTIVACSGEHTGDYSPNF